MSIDNARDRAATYFSAWAAKDFAALQGVLAPDVSFTGPMGTATGPQECVDGLRGMRENIVEDIEVDLQLVADEDVMTWFLMHTVAAGTLPVVNRMHVGPEGIDRIQVVFDPRPLFS